MRTIKFARELEFKIGKDTFALKRLIGDTWQAENQRTGAYQQFTNATLRQLYTNGEIELINVPNFTYKVKSVTNELVTGYLDNLSEDEREYVTAKRFFLSTYQKNYGAIKTVKAMKYALEREWSKISNKFPKPSASAVLKWLTKFEQSGNDIQSLFSRAHQSGNRQRRIPEDLEHICLKTINEEFMNREKHTLESVLKVAIHQVAQENSLRPKSEKLKLPTISTLKSLLKTIPPEEIYASRYGKEAARHKFRTSIGSTFADAPLSVVEIDATRLDIIAVDDLTGLPVDRPWLTVVLDVFTRCILGFYICYEPPSHASVAAALKHAIMPKVMHESINGDWPMCGIPMMLVVDNALEFHGHALKALCAELGINLSFCARKRGWSKGSIERVLKTLNSNIAELVPSGKTFNSVTERGDYDSVGKASVSLKALRLATAKYIVDVYHESFHRGIQCKPLQRWQSYINNEDIQLPANPKDLDAITGNITSRSVFHYGVEINNATYNSDELMKYRSHFKRKAVVRWNSTDLGHIYVMVPDGPILTVPVHPSKSYLQGMSYFAWKLILNESKQHKLNINNPVEIAARVHEIKEMMAADGKQNKQTRQRHLRFKNGTKAIPKASEIVQPEIRDENNTESLMKSVSITKMPVYQRNQQNNTEM